MRKIVFQEFVTIDGFAAGQDGKTSFVDFLVAEGGKEVDKDMLHFIGTIDMILLGAVTYSMFVNYWLSPQSCVSFFCYRQN